MQVARNPYISVDCVIFGFDNGELKVLLVHQKNAISENNRELIKLPGDLIIRHELLHLSAKRILMELTGVTDIFLKQFGLFDNPARLNPSEDLTWLKETSGLEVDRVITIAFYSLVKLNPTGQSNLNISENAFWHPVNNLPHLMFDHNNIVNEGLETLRKEFLTEPLCFELLPKKFTLNQLQNIYEVILGFKLDNRNFRKRINRLGYIIPLNEQQTGVNHKPARLYIFNEEKYDVLKKDHTGFVV
jgi:8-oxo-dGTP diphosphatase